MAYKISYSEKTAKYNVYMDGIRLLGLSDEISEPEIAMKTDTTKVAGGDFEDPIDGQFEAMEYEIPFRQFYGQIFDVFQPGEVVNLTLRAANQVLDGAGNSGMVGTKIVVMGKVKSLTPGSYKEGVGTGASVKLSVFAVHVTEGGESKLDIDILNGQFRVNGIDRMAAINALV